MLLHAPFRPGQSAAYTLVGRVYVFLHVSALSSVCKLVLHL